MGFSLWVCLYFTLSAFVYANSFSSLQPLCPDHDKSALLQFKRSFRIDCSVSFDPYGVYTPTAKMKSWIDGPNSDCCSWEGVECNEESGHVIGLNLTCSCIFGTFPSNSTLFNLSHLRNLTLQYNDFNFSHIPSELGRLHKLRVLSLFDSSFGGQIPAEISKLTELSFLALGDIGNLPSGYLQNWQQMMVSKEDQFDSSHTKIAYFFPIGATAVARTDIYEYTITITSKGTERLYPEILDVFRVIDFSSNKFSGKIPNIIGALKGLQALNLSNNNLEGRIPPSLANITDLESLDLSQNMLSGAIPPQLSQLTSLEVFNVSYNHLKGPIPQGNQFDTFDNSSYKGNLGLCGSPSSIKCGKADDQESPMTRDESEEHLEFIDWIVISMGCLNGFIIGFVIGKLCITDRYHEWFMETFQRRPRRRVRRTPRQRG